MTCGSSHAMLCGFLTNSRGFRLYSSGTDFLVWKEIAVVDLLGFFFFCDKIVIIRLA